MSDIKPEIGKEYYVKVITTGENYMTDIGIVYGVNFPGKKEMMAAVLPIHLIEIPSKPEEKKPENYVPTTEELYAAQVASKKKSEEKKCYQCENPMSKGLHENWCGRQDGYVSDKIKNMAKEEKKVQGYEYEFAENIIEINELSRRGYRYVRTTKDHNNFQMYLMERPIN